LILVAVFLLFTFLPLNIWWRATRVGFLHTIFNIIISPFGRLQFRDFFVADYLTSCTKPLADMGYLACWLGTFSFLETNTISGYETCTEYNTQYFSTILPIIPFWWRFAQCLNKYYYTRKAFPHLANAGKYFTGILFLLLSALRVLFTTPTSWDVFFVGIFLVHLTNSTYSLIWDYTMDWGLCRPGSKFFLLRSDLLLQAHWKYYALLIFDFVLRFAWILETILTDSLNPTLSNIFFAVLEIIRRSVWAFFRVELEALQNWEEYRTIDFVPRLQPQTSGQQPDKAVSQPARTLKRRRSHGSDQSGTSSSDRHYHTVGPFPHVMDELDSLSFSEDWSWNKNIVTTDSSTTGSDNSTKANTSAGTPTARRLSGTSIASPQATKKARVRVTSLQGLSLRKAKRNSG